MVESRGDIDDAIAIGRDNAKIRPDVEGWCNHLNVELLSVSMVGQMAHVPIGPHRLSCKHAKNSIQSIVLRNLFHSFLPDNCAGCPHYSTGPRPEAGQTVISESQIQADINEELKRNRRSEIARLRGELIQLGTSGVGESHSEVASILRLTVELFADEVNNNAHLLREASHLAPQLFDEKVITLLELGATDAEFAIRCLPVLATLARLVPALRPRIMSCALAALALTLPIEMVCDAVDACLDNDPGIVPDSAVNTVLCSLDFHRPIGGWRTGVEPTYKHSLTVLRRLIDLGDARVIPLIRQRLTTSHKWARANICRVTEELARVRPPLGLELLPDLIRSLELPDDMYEGISADGSALDAISEIIHTHWASGRQVLGEEMPRLSIEARATLVSVYERLLKEDTSRRSQSRKLNSTAWTDVINQCMSILNDAQEEPVIRRVAADAIRHACRSGREPLVSTYNQLLGCLAIIVDQPAPTGLAPRIIIASEEASYDHEQQMLQHNRTMEWDRLKQSLKSALEEIGKHRPKEVSETLIASIDSASISNHISMMLASLDLLGKVASRHNASTLQSLPTLMQRLMDYRSPAIRARSIYAIKDAFRHSDITLPANVVDALVLQLRDSYVVVHRAAVESFRSPWVPLTAQQREEAFLALHGLWSYYAPRAEDVYFMDDLAEALVCVSSVDVQMVRSTCWVVSNLLPTAEALVDAELCELLLTIPPTTPSATTWTANALIRCLGQHHRDLHNGDAWRLEAAGWLASLPESIWTKVTEHFEECALLVASKDPLEAVTLAAVLGEHGQHAVEAAVLSTAMQSATDHSLYHGLNKEIALIQSYAARELGNVEQL